jgi:Zn-dependent M28 family amino/carboxypeptidase
VADALAKRKPAVGVDLLFVDGEDYGEFTGAMRDVMIGARHYAEHPLSDDRPLFAVLFDMVGDKDLRLPREENSEVAAPDVVDRVWNTAERMGYGHIFVTASQGAVTDDHTPLINAGFRAIDIIDFTYDAWHTEDDTIDKVSAASLEAVGNVAVAVIRGALN